MILICIRSNSICCHDNILRLMSCESFTCDKYFASCLGNMIRQNNMNKYIKSLSQHIQVNNYPRYEDNEDNLLGTMKLE